MPYTKKLPSGSWCCQFRLNGKTKTVTAPTKAEAKLKAAEMQLEQERKERTGLTVKEACEKYIRSRDGILSPSTIQGYNKIVDYYLGEIADRPLKLLAQEDYQSFVNDLAKKKTYKGKEFSPKSIANICGLIESSAKYVGEHLTADRPAPRKQVVTLLPPERVISIVRDSAIELPVLLAMWLSLSMSEIRGLTVDSVRDCLLVVKGATIDIDGVPVFKESNKAYNRTRTLRLPKRIINLIHQTDAWKHGSGPLVPFRSCALHDRWIGIQRRAGVEHPMTFHQLRHLNASIMMALGLPDTYAMERGGWSSRQTLNYIYQHTLAGRVKDYDDQMDTFFEGLFSSEKSSENSSENRSKKAFTNVKLNVHDSTEKRMI